MSDAEDFPQQFVRARKHANLSQQALADALGIDKGTVKRWEGGGLKNPMPRYQRRGLIAEVLEITGAPPETFTEPPATDRVAALQKQIDDLKQTLADALFRDLDHEEESELRQYLTSDLRSEEPAPGAASE